MPNCLSCGTEIDEYDSGYYSRNMLCIPCFDRKQQAQDMASCSRCGTRMRRDEGKRRKGELYCSYCASELERMEKITICPLCRKPIESYQKTSRLANSQLVHSSCISTTETGKKSAAFCAFCGKQSSHFTILPDGRAMCRDCEKSPNKDHSHTILSSLMDRVGSMLG